MRANTRRCRRGLIYRGTDLPLLANIGLNPSVEFYSEGLKLGQTVDVQPIEGTWMYKPRIRSPPGTLERRAPASPRNVAVVAFEPSVEFRSEALSGRMYAPVFWSFGFCVVPRCGVSQGSAHVTACFCMYSFFLTI